MEVLQQQEELIEDEEEQEHKEEEARRLKKEADEKVKREEELLMAESLLPESEVCQVVKTSAIYMVDAFARSFAPKLSKTTHV